MKYKIIDQTEDYLVINKGAGVLVHGAPHLNENNLAEDLLQKFPELKGVGEDPFRPGVVHRLDKMVSGLLVVARNNRSFESLKEQFQKRRTEKIYTALVYGAVSKDEDEIHFPIKRSTKGFKMAAAPVTDKGKLNTEGRDAATEFDVIKRYINYTLLEVRIRTGRTHQIRVHMSAYGHPIVGDDLYGTKKTRVKNKKLDLGRIFLVARELAFADLRGEEKRYKIKLPSKLENFLKEIK